MRKSLLFLCVFLLIAGCGVKPSAQGNMNEVVVFADHEVYIRCRESLSRALERIIDTPQPEKVFTLKPVPFDSFNYHTNSPNIILMGTLEGDGDYSEFLRGMLDEVSFKGVKNGVYWFFAKEDAWYNKQLLLVTVASDAQELDSRIQFGGEELFEVLNESVLERLSKMLYGQMERRDLAEKIQEKYGFSIRVQHDYLLIREEPAERFIRLRRYNPDRFLTISWMEADTLTGEMLIDERVRLGELFTDQVRIEPDYNRIQPDSHIYPNGYLLRGLWATLDEAIGGGPFFTYGVYDEERSTVYFIHGSVFNPGQDKLPFLRQLEVMARTFQFSGESVEDRYE